MQAEGRGRGGASLLPNQIPRGVVMLLPFSFAHFRIDHD